MKTSTPAWGQTSRFYLPNEDAAVLRAALKLLPELPRHPVFVGGSGMLLLEASRLLLPDLESAVFVDLAAFQCEYADRLLQGLARSPQPAALQTWFADEIYPELRQYLLQRQMQYELQEVMDALQNKFGIEFMFNPEAHAAAKALVQLVYLVNMDIKSYLAACQHPHDFIYLSNITDYLPPEDSKELFAVCQACKAPVYLLLSSACHNRAALHDAWQANGYAPHPANRQLDAMNRGLGSSTLQTAWNRPGTIYLLMPHQA